MDNKDKKTITLGLNRKDPILGVGEPVSSMIKKERVVSVYLVSGIKLVGIIVNQYEDSIVLRNANDQLVYKHAISTICLSSGQFIYD